MRICVGMLATAAVIFTAGAIGTLGTWALSAGTVLGLVAAICTVTLMEERELAPVRQPNELSYD